MMMHNKTICTSGTHNAGKEKRHTSRWWQHTCLTSSAHLCHLYDDMSDLKSNGNSLGKRNKNTHLRGFSPNDNR